MPSKFRGLKWPLLAFLIVFLLYSVHINKDMLKGSEIIEDKKLFDSPSYYNLTSEFNEDEEEERNEEDAFELDLTVEEQLLFVNEPVITEEDIQELSNDYDITIVNQIPKWTEKDLEFFKTVAGETVFSQLSLIDEMGEKPNFSSITAAERLFKSLFMHFNKVLTDNPLASVESDPDHKDAWNLYKRLEKSLFPWIYPYWENVFHINNHTNKEERGIVISVGNNQFKYAVASIRAIRDLFNCSLPIEIFYVRDNDLSETKRTYLTTQFSNVRLMKLDKYIGEYYTKFGGWAMKPFAILSSRFTELIMLDADAYFLQDPSLLFEDEGYKKTGTLFFYDRTLFPNWNKGPDWLRSFLPTMSSLVEKTRWFKRLTSHEQESGVVVVDKKVSLMGLLAVCKLNGVNERDQVVYKHVHGDKETFWIGYEMMQTPYTFVKSYGAVIGQMGRGDNDGAPDTVCGVQLHLDRYGKPLWLNGGLYRSKHSKPLEYLSFTHYAEGDDWEFSTHCIRNKDKIHKLDPVQRKIALDSIQFDIERDKIQDLIDNDKWTPEFKYQKNKEVESN